MVTLSLSGNERIRWHRPPRKILKNYKKYYENCRLCPRNCGINRVAGRRNDETGFCGETDRLRVAYVGPHFGEEPPLTGDSGSGTIFFTGCSLRCSFCQNFQISHQGKGDSIEMDTLLRDIEKMIRFLYYWFLYTT